MTNTSENFGHCSLAAFHKHVGKISKYYPRVLKDKDAEDLHQLRVGMRRLRTAIAAFGPAVQLPKGITEGRVGAMGRVLGVQRDNDVLQTLLLDKYRPLLPDSEQVFLDHILKALAKQRKQAFKATVKLLTQEKFTTFLQKWEQWLENPEFTSLGHQEMAWVLPDLLLPQISQFFLHPGWLVDTASGEEPILHDLRKEAKRSRYLLELFVDCYGEDYQQLLAQIKMTQEILGDLQDGFVLQTMVEHLLDVELTSLCPQWHAVFHGDRQQHWDQWHPLQCQFTDPVYRHHCRQLLQNPLPSSEFSPSYPAVADPS